MDKSVKLVIALISIVSFMGIAVMLVSAIASNDEALIEQRQFYLARAEQLMEHGIYFDALGELNNALSVFRDNDPNILYDMVIAHHSLYEKHNSEYHLEQYRNTVQTILDNGVLPDEMTLADLYYDHAIPHDFANRRLRDVIDLLENSWKRTNDERIFRLYQEHRYSYIERRGLYNHAEPIVNGSARVQCIDNNKWGFVNANGNNMINPQFDLATNFMNNFAVVKRDDVLQFVDNNGFRRGANLEIKVTDIAYFNGSEFALSETVRGKNIYVIAMRNDFMIDKWDTEYHFVGMFYNGAQALQNKDGKWGIFNLRNEKAATGFIFDEIAVDELGRAVIGNRFFAKESGKFYLMSFDASSDGSLSWQRVSNEAFDEAKPFFEQGGLAAVRRGNKWGFINSDGEMVIPFEYDDARSSSFSFAPVMISDLLGENLWGYLTLERFPEPWEDYFGTMAIKPQFLEAKQFVNGVAPVKTEHGWIYISLIAYS
jgi:hypothetical protein